ncbi:MAG: glycosyltransferase family 2 protein [Acidobacteriota bacterium]
MAPAAPSGTTLAVVLNFNGGTDTTTSVEHLAKQRPSPPDVLVVDNASSDTSLAHLAESRLPCRVLKLGENRGFAGGMNAGLEEARAGGYRYVWLVNNDAFTHPDSLALLVAAMDHDPRLAMVTPRLFWKDGTEQHAGGVVLDWDTGESRLVLSGDLSIDGPQPLADGTWVSGTAPLIRTTVLDSVGLLEAAYFAYWEDADLSVRMARAGWGIGAVPEAEAVHLGGGTSGGSESPFAVFLEVRNRWLFLERHAKGGSPRARWYRFYAAMLQRTGRSMAIGRPAVATAVLAGLSAARTGAYAVPKPKALLLERLCGRAPWRISRLLTAAATMLDDRSDRGAAA